MAGAYVAKPAVVSVPDVPPGWDDDNSGGWPFPGALPPGYSMELTFPMVSTATTWPAEAHDAEVTLRDHDDYGTTEPEPDIVWRATLDGTPLQLKFSGGASFLDSISSTYASIGDFWGAEPTIEFDIDAGDAGLLIVLQAISQPFTGYSGVEGTANITTLSEAPPDLPTGCSSVGEKIPCEYGQSDLLHTTMAAVADLDCGDSCITENPGCGVLSYCRFMDWAPAIAGLLVGVPGFTSRSWHVKRYNTVTEQYANSSTIFPTGKTGLIACDGTLTPTARSTSGTSGMRLQGDGSSNELHVFVKCPSSAIIDDVYQRYQTCQDESCE